MRCVSVAVSSTNIFAFSSNGGACLEARNGSVYIYIGVSSSLYIRCKYRCLCFELLLSLEGFVASCWRPLMGTHKTLFAF